MAGPTLLLDDLAATRAFGRRLAALLRPGDLVGLEGELGAGKTELARAVIRARAGVELEVPSPTFTLVQPYRLPSLLVTHAELYRLGAPEEVLELGLDEALAEGALVVEWPERAGELLPAERLTLRLALAPESGLEARLLTVEAAGGWRERLAGLQP
ncbi:MAG TPA: tRNA (adenosine(37)-N6)-threonylcarbamoyltransferase complex ATPase subunit type 1 TsaE [Geminicoccaceae bacterium]|nr:tRNA (adenosine(37)-N6)-threonylcarbamoyltransferase complex ATPase subunit type 1 TsaE [Geminicoccaceae bacterium]